MDAIQVLQKRKCQMQWKFIVFKHNQHQISEANTLSKKLGFDKFKLEKSDRWLGKKDLMPDREYIDSYYEQQQNILVDKNFQTEMKPWCIEKNQPSKDLYIDAEGNFYPCCWIGTYRYKYNNVFSHKTSDFNIKNNTLETILNNQKVKEFFESTKDFNSAHECCKIQCGVKNG